MTPQDELDYLRRLAEAGINFYVSMPTGGCCDLEIAEVGIYLVDPSAYWARTYGVSRSNFIAWLEWHDNPQGVQCEHKKKGRQCRNRVIAPTRPSEYEPDEPRLCRVHKGKS